VDPAVTPPARRVPLQSDGVAGTALDRLRARFLLLPLVNAIIPADGSSPRVDCSPDDTCLSLLPGCGTEEVEIRTFRDQ
jgi:hypothetical protein